MALKMIARALLCAPLTLVVVKPASAQPIPPIINVPDAAAGSLIIDQQRQDRRPVLPPTPSTPAPAPRLDVRTLDGLSSTAPLRRLRVEGSSAPTALLERVTLPFIGKTLDGETIAQIANAFAEAYRDGDVALYTVVVPDQKLDDGVLTLRVVEGYIADAVVTGDVKGRDLSLVQHYAARLTAEKPLRRVTLERYMSLIRDIPGLEADVQMLNLSTPGAVRLVLTLKHDDIDFGLAVNNRGIANLGRTQLQANVTLNSSFRQGDQTRITFAAPTDVDRYQYYALSHSQPLGTDGMRIAANIGYLKTRPGDLPIKGEAKSAGVTLSYPLRRGYRDNIYVSLGLDGLDSDNALFGQIFASDHSRALRGAASWSKISEKSFLSLGATASQGLDILAARADPQRTDITFTKLNGQAAYNRLMGKSIALRLSATGQLSSRRLPGSEQFTLGGDTIGRAFPSAYVIGDRGLGGSAELAWIANALWPGALKGSELFAFIDGGKVWADSRFDGLVPKQDYRLASAGGGMRVNISQKIVVSLEAARQLALPYDNTSKGWRYIIGWRSLI